MMMPKTNAKNTKTAEILAITDIFKQVRKYTQQPHEEETKGQINFVEPLSLAPLGLQKCLDQRVFDGVAVLPTVVHIHQRLHFFHRFVTITFLVWWKKKAIVKA
ncbi:hypothetical protein E2C01_019379 [Portunus trituberculatus]|uniref:Uncharacterized protein n=1 Tax=Portunus trituberculatus TaxID=210409 RepID=A0A5B7E099_PORTR|nr:hypothetical protein [Portunus trituberculatus]